MEIETNLRNNLANLQMRQQEIHRERARLNIEERGLIDKKFDLYEELGRVMLIGGSDGALES